VTFCLVALEIKGIENIPTGTQTAVSNPLSLPPEASASSTTTESESSSSAENSTSNYPNLSHEIPRRTHEEAPGFTFKKIVKLPKESEPEQYLVSNGFIANAMHELLFGDENDEQGAVIISGTTGCGKTEVAKAFIRHVMRKHQEIALSKDDKRLPHFVTFEDPIENWSLKKGNSSIDLMNQGDCVSSYLVNRTCDRYSSSQAAVRRLFLIPTLAVFSFFNKLNAVRRRRLKFAAA